MTKMWNKFSSLLLDLRGKGGKIRIFWLKGDGTLLRGLSCDVVFIVDQEQKGRGGYNIILYVI